MSIANFPNAVANAISAESPTMPKNQLKDYLVEVLEEKRTMTATEIADRSGMSTGYLSELKRGIKPIDSLSVDLIVRLARGLNESPERIFQLATNRSKHKVTSADALEILEEFSQLTPAQQEKCQFILEHLKTTVHALRKLSR